jgi:hypothetical protein
MKLNFDFEEALFVVGDDGNRLLNVLLILLFAMTAISAMNTIERVKTIRNSLKEKKRWNRSDLLLLVPVK